MAFKIGSHFFNSLKIVCPQLNTKSCVSNFICQLCPAAKQSRVSFYSSSIKIKTVFELVHLDVWGLYRTRIHDGCTHFLTIVDDFSQYTWVHLMKHKYEVPEILVKFVVYVNTQFNTAIKCITTKM